MKVGFLIGLCTGLLFMTGWQYFRGLDGYYLSKYSVSPDGKEVGVVVVNMGGGGPGYCRDLVYKFPNRDVLPMFSNESDNKQFLVKELGCGEANELKWKMGELEIK